MVEKSKRAIRRHHNARLLERARNISRKWVCRAYSMAVLDVATSLGLPGADVRAFSSLIVAVGVGPLGGPDNLLSGRAKRAGGDRVYSLVTSRGLRPPGQRVVRATPKVRLIKWKTL